MQYVPREREPTVQQWDCNRHMKQRAELAPGFSNKPSFKSSLASPCTAVQCPLLAVPQLLPQSAVARAVK